MSAVTDISHVSHVACPSALRDLRAWLVWRYEPNENPGGKPLKVPYYAAGGKRHGVQGRPEDVERMVTFDAARAACARRRMDGVGFATLPQHSIVALDFDACVDPAGRIHPEVLECLAGTYAEFSPSGTGIHALFTGAISRDHKSHAGRAPEFHEFGVETFYNKGFVTFTGNILPLCDMLGDSDTLAPLSTAAQALVRSRLRRDLLEPRVAGANADTEVLGLTEAQIAQALDVLPDDLPYEASDGPSWLGVGMALHHETGGAGFETWDTWSQKSPKYTAREYGLARWNSFGKHGSGPTTTARSLVHWANAHGAHIDLHGPASAEEFDTVAEPVAGNPATPKPPRFTPVPMAEFANAKALNWTVKGILPRAALVVLFGDSGSGKTFITLQLAAAVARGVPWRGRKVRQGRVVYVCAEGRHGFAMRGAAYAAHAEVPWSDVPLDVIADAPNLMLKEDALALAKAIGKADLVVVDTLAQTMPGGNENAGEDVGRVLAHCQGLHRATGATVLLVHHSGKDASKGARGWSGLRAAADAELEVIRTPSGRLLRTGKEKDGPDDIEFGFALEVVPLGVDEDGDPITSCAVVEAEVPSARILRVLGPNEEIVNAVVQEMAQAQTAGIEVAAVLREAVKRMPAPQEGKRDTRKQHAKRALETLCKGDDAPYWLHTEDGTLEVV